MRSKRRNPDRVPAWMWTLICIILGIAVVIGIVAFVLQMGYFKEGFDLNAIPTNMEVTEEPEATEEPEEEEPEDLSCTELVLSQEEVILEEVGDKLFLTAMAEPDGCEDPVIFESSDEEIVAVTASGMVTAVAPGEADILVTCGQIQRICKVMCVFEIPEEEEETEQTEEDEQTQQEQEEQTEEQQPAAPVEVTPSDFTLFYPGEEAYLTVKNAPEGAAVSYVSSNAAVVTVSEGGKVTAVGNGQATITVTVGDVQLTAIARCNLESTTEGGTSAPAQTYTGPFTLNYTDITFQFAGEKLNLALTDANGTKVSGLNWVTGNSAVCTVSNGVVTALGSGYTTVSTTYNGTTYSCIIRTSF